MNRIFLSLILLQGTVLKIIWVLERMLQHLRTQREKGNRRKRRHNPRR